MIFFSFSFYLFLKKKMGSSWNLYRSTVDVNKSWGVASVGVASATNMGRPKDHFPLETVI